MFLILCTYYNILLLMRQSVQVVALLSSHHRCRLFINLLMYSTMEEQWIMLAHMPHSSIEPVLLVTIWDLVVT